jgi:hypothetical protein
VPLLPFELEKRMKKISLLTLAILLVAVFSSQTVTAQLPKIPKIGKPGQPKPQPTATDSAPPTTNNSQPAQPQPENTKTTASTPGAPTINRPSIQITLRTHQQYYRGAKEDQETWSWTPRIVYRVNGPISAGGQLSVGFTLPSGKPWINLDCKTQETAAGSWWETECGMNSNDVKDQDASIETGLAGFKINLKNELEATNQTLFVGKFKVEKFHVGVVDLPQFKNNFSYYVNYDWNLPVGYVYSYDAMDARPGYPPSPTEGRFSFVTWFRGDPNILDYGKYVAYLYYQGKLVADSSGEGGKYGNTGCEVTNTAYNESAFGYCRRKFVVNAMVWDKQPEFHPQDFKMYENAGEYEIKVLQNGKLARTARFTMGSNYQIVDTGIGPKNSLGTGRVVVAVQVIGDQDGQWDRNAYKTDAFYANPLAGFVAP